MAGWGDLLQFPVVPQYVQYIGCTRKYADYYHSRRGEGCSFKIVSLVLQEFHSIKICEPNSTTQPPNFATALD